MKDFSGISPATLPDSRDEMFVPRVRSMLNDVDIYLREVSRGMARIQQGEVPDGSGETIVSPVSPTLDDYLYLPGRIGGQRLQSASTSENVFSIRAVTSQTGNLLRFEDGSGGLLGFVKSNGAIRIGDESLSSGTLPFITLEYLATYSYLHANNSGGIKFIPHYVSSNGRIEFSSSNGLAYLFGMQLSTGFTDSASTGRLELGGTVASGLSVERKAAICGYLGTAIPRLGISATAISIGNAAIGSLQVPVAIVDIVNYSGVGTVVGRIQALAGQTGNLLEFRDSASALLSRVTSAGAWDGPIASTGSATFLDTLFRIQDNADTTKLLAFELGGFTTATTRTLTPPNASTTIAGLGVAQTFTAAQTFEPSSNVIPFYIKGTNVSGANLLEVETNAALTAMTVDFSGAINFASSFSVYAGDIGTTDAALFDASGITGPVALTIPTIDGTLVITAGTQTITGNKTFSGSTTISGLASVLRSSTATSGVRFGDNTDTTKALRMVLSGCSTGADNSFTFVSTADRNYGFQNLAGNIPVVGDDAPAVASGALGKVDLTAQAADITPAVNLSSTPPAGLYQVEVYLVCTALDAGAGTATVTIGWTDALGATTDATISKALTSTGRAYGVIPIQVNSGDITYSVTGGGTYGTARFAIYIRVIALG